MVLGQSQSYDTSQQHDTLDSVADAGARTQRGIGGVVNQSRAQDGSYQTESNVAVITLCPGNTQDYEEFDENWTKEQEELLQQSEVNDTFSHHRQVLEHEEQMVQRSMKSHGALPVQRNPNGMILSSSINIHDLCIIALTRPPNNLQQTAGIEQRNPHAWERPREPYQGQSRARQPHQADNMYQSQSNSHASRPNNREIPDSQDIVSPQPDPVIVENGLADTTPVPTIQEEPTQRQSIQDRWKLKRKARLQDLGAKSSEKELLVAPYSSLKDERHTSESDGTNPTDFAELDKWIKSIIDRHDNEDELIPQMAKLHDNAWTELGKRLAIEHEKTIKELRELRTRKHDLSAKFEAEVDKMMQQVETNDKIVEGRLQNLRSFGTQMLGGVNGIAETSQD